MLLLEQLYFIERRPQFGCALLYFFFKMIGVIFKFLPCKLDRRNHAVERTREKANFISNARLDLNLKISTIDTINPTQQGFERAYQYSQKENAETRENNDSHSQKDERELQAYGVNDCPV